MKKSFSLIRAMRPSQPVNLKKSLPASYFIEVPGRSRTSSAFTSLVLRADYVCECERPFDLNGRKHDCSIRSNETVIKWLSAPATAETLRHRQQFTNVLARAPLVHFPASGWILQSALRSLPHSFNSSLQSVVSETHHASILERPDNPGLGPVSKLVTRWVANRPDPLTTGENYE